MKLFKHVFIAGLITVIPNAHAGVASFDSISDPGIFQLSESTPERDRVTAEERIYLAGRSSSSTKTTTKTKKNGDVVTREVTKTNDGNGNKTTTKTKTTTPASSGSGSGGASYEGW